MTQEILYTSAPRGLKPGSRGFCTVASTSGMDQNLAERLESLSGYRAAFEIHDARAALNPINYSHLRISIGGQIYHVLSRVCDAGLDYTKRSNKLAHHVALDPSECTPGGPAWVLAGDGFCETRWEGEPRILPAGRRPRGDQCPSAVCATWARMTGDAGWGGVLAESAADAQQTMWVIFRAGTNLLPLVVESLSLLASQQRWKVTFSTYYTKLPAGVDCQWRFLLDDSDDARRMRRDPRERVIDLCKTLGKASGGPLVEAARTGMVAAPVARQQPPRLPPLEPMAVRPGAEVRPAARAEAAAPAWIRPEANAPLSPVLYLEPEQQRGSRWSFVAIGLGIALLVAAIFVGGLVIGTTYSRVPAPGQLVAATPAESSKPATKPVESLLPSELKDLSSEKLASKPVPVDDDFLKPKPAPKKEPEALASVSKPIEPKPAPPPKPARGPFEEIRARHSALPLPVWKHILSRDDATSHKLVGLPIADPKDCSLEILGSEQILGEGRSFTIRRSEKAKPGVPTWSVLAKAKSALGGPSEIAEFCLENDALHFRWFNAPNSAKPKCLQFCLLKIQAAGDEEQCSLYESRVEPPLPLDFSGQSYWALPLQPEAAPAEELLRLGVTLEGMTFDVSGSMPMSCKQKCIFSLRQTAGKVDGERFFELELEFGSLTEGYFVRFRRFGFIRQPGSTNASWRQPIDETYVSDLRRRIPRQITTLGQKIGRLEHDIDQKKKELQRLQTDLQKWQSQKNMYAPPKDQGGDRPPEPAVDRRTLEAIDRHIAMYAGQVKLCKPELEGLEKELRTSRGDKEMCEKDRVWCDEMDKLFVKLRHDVKLHYRVFALIDGKQVDLIRTERVQGETSKRKAM